MGTSGVISHMASWKINYEWRFSSLGKSPISMVHGFQHAMELMTLEGFATATNFFKILQEVPPGKNTWHPGLSSFWFFSFARSTRMKLWICELLTLGARAMRLPEMAGKNHPQTDPNGRLISLILSNCLQCPYTPTGTL